MALSNATFFLAEAGLLSGRVATIYPPYARAFRDRYPDVTLRAERAITDAGDLYCANGIPAGCDLCIAIIEQLYGPAVARKVASRFLIGFNRGYALWNVRFDGLKYHRDHQVLTAQQWLERNYSERVNLADVAGDLGMSPRNFSRRFKTATGDSPHEYLQRLRIEAAKDLLRGTDLRIIEISHRVGVSDISSFNRLFKRMAHVTPTQFRDKMAPDRSPS